MMMNILLLAVILLAIATSVRLMRVFDISAKLRGREPYEISESENNTNAIMFLLSMFGLFGMFIYYTWKYYNKENILLISASEHGKAVDGLLALNFVVITIAFFITEALLLWFAYRYRYNKKRKALHYAHNNRLELVWTIIPAIVLTVLILRGLIVWNNNIYPTKDPDKLDIELYARQFDWTARFAGDDKTLGECDFTMINDFNPIGVITPELIHEQLDSLENKLRREEYRRDFGFLGGDEYDKCVTGIRRLKFQINQVMEFEHQLEENKFEATYDDIILQNEIHIPVNRTVQLHFRSQDVIHSAYLPHFRVQMYCVPGVKTGFSFKPIMTTREMQNKLGKPDFNYVLYCNNICGNAHFNMLMTIVVDTEEDFQKWYKEQKTVRVQYTERVNGPVTTPEVSDTNAVSKDTLTNPTALNK